MSLGDSDRSIRYACDVTASSLNSASLLAWEVAREQSMCVIGNFFLSSQVNEVNGGDMCSFDVCLCFCLSVSLCLYLSVCVCAADRPIRLV